MTLVNKENAFSFISKPSTEAIATEHFSSPINGAFQRLILCWFSCCWVWLGLIKRWSFSLKNTKCITCQKNNTFLVLFSSSVWLLLLLLFLIYTFFFYLSTGASVTALTLLNIINHSQIFHTFKNIHCCSLLQGCNCLEYTIFEAILKKW